MAGSPAVLRSFTILALAFVIVTPIGVRAQPRADTDATARSSSDTTVRERRQVSDDPRRPRLVGFPVAGYTPDTSVIFGGIGMLNYLTSSNSDDAPRSNVTVAGTYTLLQQWLVAVDSSTSIEEDSWRLEGSVVIQDWHADFYGVGPRTRERDLEEYTPRRVVGDFEVQRAVLHPAFYLGAGYRVMWVSMREIEDGGMLDAEGVSGVEGGYSSGPQASAVWDTRDIASFPYRGAYLQGAVRTNARGLGSDYEYAVRSLDLRAYRAFGRRAPHVLAGRIQLQSAVGDVPFYELPTLGGSDLLRGIPSGRFRDRGLWATQAEYRTPFAGPVGFVAFGGIGEVFPELRALRGRPVWSAGAGMRLRIDAENRVNIRIDYGLSRENQRGFYLSITEAF